MISNVLNFSGGYENSAISPRVAFDNHTKKLNDIINKQRELIFNTPKSKNSSPKPITMQGTGQKLDTIA